MSFRPFCLAVPQAPPCKKSRLVPLEKSAADTSRNYTVSMKTCAHRNTLGGLINERLAEIGASNIPAGARELIEADAWRACTRLVQRSVTAPRVGRAVARALAVPADLPTEGSKGAKAPLASSAGRTPSAQPHVAGPTPNTQSSLTGDTTNGADNLPTGGSV